MCYISGLQNPEPCWFSCSTAKQRLITTGKQGEWNSGWDLKPEVLWVLRIRTEEKMDRF